MTARSILVGLACSLLLLAPVPPASAAKVAASLTVPAGKTKRIQLRNLAQGTLVDVAVKSDGDIAVIFIGAAELKANPHHAQPLFAGRMERRLSFSLKIASAGNYYVFLDNSKGKESRTITVAIQTTRAEPKDLPNSKSRSF